MASFTKKGGGDFVLESRHLVGLFLLLVVIFGVVFTLGYLLGRSQYDTQLRAAVEQVRGGESRRFAQIAGKDRQDAEAAKPAPAQPRPIGISIILPNRKQPKIICKRRKRRSRRRNPPSPSPPEPLRSRHRKGVRLRSTRH